MSSEYIIRFQKNRVITLPTDFCEQNNWKAGDIIDMNMLDRNTLSLIKRQA